MPIEKITSKVERRRVCRTNTAPIANNDTHALKRDLDTWLSCHTSWNHEEWLGLLADLAGKGYTDLIDTPKGQELIGRYLEQRKNCGTC
jgi:hypothetical protein